MARFVRKRKDIKRESGDVTDAGDTGESQADDDADMARNDTSGERKPDGNDAQTAVAVADPPDTNVDDTADVSVDDSAPPPASESSVPATGAGDQPETGADSDMPQSADSGDGPGDQPGTPDAKPATDDDASPLGTLKEVADAARDTVVEAAGAAEAAADSAFDAAKDAVDDVRRTVSKNRRKRPPNGGGRDHNKGGGRDQNKGGNAKNKTRSAAESGSESEPDKDDRVRSQMLVHVDGGKVHVAILEGRTLVEHYVTHRHAQSIAGNIYLGKVQNVLPGMEAAFIDIGTSKNAVLYVGDVRVVPDEGGSKKRRIEDILEVGQPVLVQVVKDPMGAKGARLTTDISLPGRFVVLVPEDDSTGISRRLADDERNRLRETLRKLRPDGFGIIVRTAAEQTAEAQLKLDIDALEELWHEVYTVATRANPPVLIYEEPDLVIRTVREVFSSEFRRLIVDDSEVHAAVSGYLGDFDPDLVSRVQLYDDELPLFERYHVSEQIKQGLARKVWLPSGGSLVFDYGEALTVIDVNTAKNVGNDSLEQTVYENNLEAADEIARQLRLRDIGGIIVIDFIDMEIKKNREGVQRSFKQAMNRDKTKTQVYEISELGLVEMTRKNVSEGLLGNFSKLCTECDGTGRVVQEDLLP